MKTILINDNDAITGCLKKRVVRRLIMLILGMLFSQVYAAPKQAVLHDAQAGDFSVYVAGSPQAKHAVVLVHDWFGVSPFFLSAIDHLAAQGYRVMGVDLYNNQQATDHTGAGRLMQQLDSIVAKKKIEQAISTLSSSHRPIALWAFSMGSQPTIEVAVANQQVKATVIWYGQLPQEAAQLRGMNRPILVVAGAHDGEAIQQVATFSQAAKEAGVAAETYVYPGAAHAFAQPLFNQGQGYDEQATQAAWQISLQFLSRRLGEIKQNRANRVKTPQ